MDEVVELGELWHGDVEGRRRVRRAVGELARILEVARVRGGVEGVRRRWGGAGATQRRASRVATMTPPLCCPFCGHYPHTRPASDEDAARTGNAYGKVWCSNQACPAQPVVTDGQRVADTRGWRADGAGAMAP